MPKKLSLFKDLIVPRGLNKDLRVGRDSSLETLNLKNTYLTLILRRNPKNCRR